MPQNIKLVSNLVTISSLKNSKEFDFVNKNGNKKHGSYFILILAKNFTPGASTNKSRLSKNNQTNQESRKHDLKDITFKNSDMDNLVEKNSILNNKPLGESTVFGMKVSRKLSKKAVIRNKVKRRIRHLVRDLANNSTISTDNTSFIIIPKKEFITASFKQLSSDFYTTFIKARS